MADCDLVAVRRCMEKADVARQALQEERLLSSTGGWRLDDEAYAELQVRRAEIDAAYAKHVSFESE